MARRKRQRGAEAPAEEATVEETPSEAEEAAVEEQSPTEAESVVEEPAADSQESPADLEDESSEDIADDELAREVPSERPPVEDFAGEVARVEPFEPRLPAGMIGVRSVDGRPMFRAGRRWGADEVIVREDELSRDELNALEDEDLLLVRRGG